ncbi:MAG TPA: hypothetical protein VMK32_14640 [Burkholderiaceae bacterium]|nr:hypothetical protein [Burkholderiaceae bacterium]
MTALNQTPNRRPSMTQPMTKALGATQALFIRGQTEYGDDVAPGETFLPVVLDAADVFCAALPLAKAAPNRRHCRPERLTINGWRDSPCADRDD